MIRVFDRCQILKHRSRKLPHISKHPYFLMDWTMEQIMDRLSFIKKEFGVCAQIGCRGESLKNKIRGEKLYFTTDITSNNYKPDILCDEEFLPFLPHSIDLVISSLNLHTVNDLPGCLLQIKNILKPDGLFMAAILGGETLKELRECLGETELEIYGGITPRVAPFTDKQQIGGLLQRAGFALPVVDSDIITVTYDSIFHLMRDLRMMGEGNAILERQRTFTKKSLFFRAGEIYSQKYASKDGRINASFEIIFMTGWSPHESQQKPLKPGSAQSRLSDILGTTEIGTGEKPN